jgi:hypothetical protein
MHLELSIELGDEQLIVEKVDDKLRRITYMGRITFSKYVLLDSNEEIRVLHTMFTSGDVGADCIYIDLARSIIIPPGKKVELSLSIPMDIKVVLVDGDKETEIVSIPRELKYALYGPPDIGHICRYKKVLEETKKDEPIYNIKVTAYNRFEEPMTLTKIIIPHEFFKEKLTHIQIVIENRNYAYIFYKDEVSDIFGSGWFAFRNKNKFIMSHGF